jgi:hypothetical protein
MKSPILRLTQQGKTIGIRVDAVLAVTVPSEGRAGSLIHLNTHGSPSTVLVGEEPDVVLSMVDDLLGVSKAPIRMFSPHPHK